MIKISIYNHEKPVSRTLLALLVSLCLVPGALAGPQLSITPETFDLGIVALELLQKPVPCEVTLENTGNELLRITKIRTSCGCMNAKVESTELAPGAKTSLKVDIDLKGRYGTVRKQVYVESNATPETRRLTLTAEVPDTRTGVELQPALLTIKAGKSGGIMIHNFDETPAEITTVGLPEGYTLETNLPLTVPAKGHTRLTVNASSATAGGERQPFTVTATGHDKLSGWILTSASRTPRQTQIAESAIIPEPSSISTSGALAVKPETAKPEPENSAESAISPVTEVEGVLLLHLIKSLRRVNDLYFLDVRDTVNFNNGHVPSSTSFPPERWHEGRTMWPKQAILVVLAADEAASLRAATVFARWGYREIFRLKGSVEQWPGELVSGTMAGNNAGERQ